MEFKTKSYNLEKIKFHIKNKKFFFIFDTTDLNNKDWLKIEQGFKKSNLKFYKFNNKTIKFFLNDTLFKNLQSIINGPLKLVYLTNKEKSLKEIKDLQTLHSSYNFQFYLIKLNNKIYSNLQSIKLKSLNYNTNLFKLQKSLNNNLHINIAKLSE